MTPEPTQRDAVVEALEAWNAAKPGNESHRLFEALRQALEDDLGPGYATFSEVLELALRRKSAAQAALIERQAAEIAGLSQELADAAGWNSIVERVGLDGFDAAADAWLKLDPIERTNNAVASVFSKWASEDIMTRFKAHMTTTIHQAFVEGAIIGSRAMEMAIGARLTAAEAEVARLKALISPFHEAAERYFDVNRNWQNTGWTAAERRFSDGECEDTAIEAAVSKLLPEHFQALAALERTTP